MFSNFDWPRPPYFELPAGAEFTGHEPALLVLARGPKLSGMLTRFLPSHGMHAAGLFLYVANYGDTVLRTFVPAGAIRSQRIGKPLGEILVDEKLLTDSQIRGGPDLQRKLREQKLGELLEAQKVIDRDDLSAALERQRSRPMVRLGEALVGSGVISAEQRHREMPARSHRPARSPRGRELTMRPAPRIPGAALAALAALLAGAALAAPAELGFSRSVSDGLLAYYQRLFGPGAGPRLQGWKDFVKAADVKAAQGELLRPVNGFFNRVPSRTDAAHWGSEDYWATPAETLASNGGDCEDYAIAKYFTLKELGVPVARLRLVYAKTQRSGTAHMVLAYYADAKADPLILDNLTGAIEPASERGDLIPVYSFNDEDLLFQQAGVPAVRVSAASNRKWSDLMQKLEREIRL